ncbi:hypothetical protein AB7W62_16810 [Morganella morganii]
MTDNNRRRGTDIDITRVCRIISGKPGCAIECVNYTGAFDIRG